MRLPQIKLHLAGHKCCLDEHESYEAQTSLWQRFKHWCYSRILISERNRAGRQIYRSSAMRFLEKERHHLSKNYYIVHPFSDFRLVWQIYMILVLGACLAFIPYTFSMFMPGDGEEEDVDNYLKHTNFIIVLDICSCLDIGMNFFTGYHVMSTKEIVLEQRRIVRRYLLGYFMLDFLSSFPLDWFTMMIFPVDIEWNAFHSPYNAFLVVLSYMKVFRSFTFLRYVQDVCKAFGVHMFKYRALHIMLVFSILLHWTSCAQFIMPYAIHGLYLTNVTSPDYNRSWVNHYQITNESSIRRLREAVARALGALTLTGPCTPINDYFLEDLLDRPVMVILGRIFTAYALVYVYLMTRSTVESHSMNALMMDQLNTFMYHRNFPPRLKHRMREFFEFHYRKRYFRKHNIISSMPDLLRDEMNMVTCRRLLENVAIFKNQPYHVISKIVSAMRREVFLENDVIFKYNTVGNCMYFMASGKVGVFIPFNEGSVGFYKESHHLVDGDHLGEIALINEDKLRSMTAIALETTEVYRLEREDFNDMIVKNYEMFRQLVRVAEERMNRVAKGLEGLDL